MRWIYGPGLFLVTSIAVAGSAIVSWTPPQTNTDGSTIPANGDGALVDYRALYGLCAASQLPSNPSEVVVGHPSSSVEITGLGPGDWCFGVRARNNLGGESELSNIAVKSIAEPNTAPVLTHPGKQTNYVGQAVNLQLQASDIDGDPLVFSAQNLPSGLTMNTLGTITGVVNTVQNYYVNVTVEDVNGGSDSLGFGWDVLAIPIPNPPTIVSVETVAYQLKVKGNGGMFASREVGYVPLGTECGDFVFSSFGVNYHVMPRSSVTLTTNRLKPDETIVVVCAAS